MFRFAIAAALLSAFVFAAPASDKVIKRVLTTQTSASSGQEMFDNYCTVCHGKEGKGNGPAASALNKAPTDLSTLTARNNGKFPELRIFATVQGDTDDVAAHGSRDMPIWGKVFRDMGRGSNSEMQMRISNLVAYVKGLQTK